VRNCAADQVRFRPNVVQTKTERFATFRISEGVNFV
jgi:hypothetical protein